VREHLLALRRQARAHVQHHREVVAVRPQNVDPLARPDRVRAPARNVALLEPEQQPREHEDHRHERDGRGLQLPHRDEIAARGPALTLRAALTLLTLRARGASPTTHHRPPM
jgi:hypothetical protein